MTWSRVRAALPSRAFVVAGSIIAMSVMVGVTPQPVTAAPAPVYGRYCSSGAPIRSVSTTDKVVSFTFDDGPWPTNTAAVMSTFERYGWRANFFMIGSNVNQYPDIARSVVRRGHGVAAHSVSHGYGVWTIASEAGRSRDIIQSVTGVRTTFFRSPGLTMSSTIDRAVYAAGMCNVSTASDLGDWTLPRVSSWTLCDRVRRNLRPGAIFLLHDGGSHRQTVDAVSCMLDTVRRNGYQVVDLGALLSRRYALSAPTTPTVPSTTCQTSYYGQRSSAVAAAQRAVMNTGIYLRGGADGYYGSYTRSAVMTFQSARSLPVTGGVDRATATALGICPASSTSGTTTSPTTWTTVRIGQRGTTVAAMQRAIISSGIYLFGGADGIFGSYSEAALRKYQTNRGLPATGVLDQATAIKMGLFTLPTPASRTTTSTTTTSTTTTSTTTTSTTTTSTTTTTQPESTTSSSSSTTTSDPAPSAVGDVVWYDANGDLQRGDSELGLAGLDIRLVDTVTGTTRAVITGADGAFDVGEVLPGSYRLEVVLPANRSLSAPGADAVEFVVVPLVDRPDVPEQVGTVSFVVTTTVDELGLELALFDTP